MDRWVGTEISTVARRRLNQVAASFGIDLIYLFGSQVRLGVEALSEGSVQAAIDPLTDLDVGVVFAKGSLSARGRHRLYSALHHELQALFEPLRVDLAFLEENHSVFQAGALRGVCIYRTSEERQYSYEEEVARRSADFRPVLDRYLDEILEEV